MPFTYTAKPLHLRTHPRNPRWRDCLLSASEGREDSLRLLLGRREPRGSLRNPERRERASDREEGENPGDPGVNPSRSSSSEPQRQLGLRGAISRAQRVDRERQLLEEKQRQAGRVDVVMALILEPVESTLATFLLTWNPHNWPWENLEDEVRITAAGRPVDERWSCGNTKRIRVGDRLFLLRQAVEPRGIMAAGWATSATYEGPHWDPERRNRGDTALHVDTRFDRILNPDFDDILPLASLQFGALGSVNWSTPASGIQIRQGVEELERLWAELVGVYQLAGDEAVGALEGERLVAMSRHRARERWLREEKITEVKRTNGGRLPCEACGFNFFEVYGEIGRDYAQVHHLKPLSDRTKPSLTKLGDLAVLCANCHVMVHRGTYVRSLKELMTGRICAHVIVVLGLSESRLRWRLHQQCCQTSPLVSTQARRQNRRKSFVVSSSRFRSFSPLRLSPSLDVRWALSWLQQSPGTSWKAT